MTFFSQDIPVLKVCPNTPTTDSVLSCCAEVKESASDVIDEDRDELNKEIRRYYFEQWRGFNLKFEFMIAVFENRVKGTLRP